MIGRCGLLLIGIVVAFVGNGAARAADTPIPLDVALGDVSLNKVPFLIAGDTGIYARNGLDVHQFITPAAADVARHSGVIVPAEYIKADISSAPIDIGGGSPMIYRVANSSHAVERVLLATTESTIRDHVIAAPNVASVEDLMGKRLGYSVPGAVTHLGALAWIKKMGWEPGRDITLVGSGNALNPLKEGKEDAFLGSAMLIAMAPEMKLRDLIDLSQYKIPVAGSSILAEKNWLKGNRDAAARFVTSAVEAIALMKTDKRAFDAALAKWFAITDRVTQDRMYHFVADLPAIPRGRRHQEHARDLRFAADAQAQGRRFLRCELHDRAGQIGCYRPAIQVTASAHCDVRYQVGIGPVIVMLQRLRLAIFRHAAASSKF